MYEFDIKFKNEKVATISLNREEGTFTGELFTDEVFKTPFFPPITYEKVFCFIRSRCFDRGRPDSRKLLDFFGVEEYNVYDIARATHGVSVRDFFWMEFPGESLTWEEVKVRE